MLEYYVFDGSDTDTVNVYINITASNVIPPDFAQDVYDVRDMLQEEDQDQTYPFLLTTVRLYCLELESRIWELVWFYTLKGPTYS